jgi:hypothetical protein
VIASGTTAVNAVSQPPSFLVASVREDLLGAREGYVRTRTDGPRTRAYRRRMRIRPANHPSATFVGAAPRADGLWISAWTTADGVLCATLGAVPRDASTSKRGARHDSESAARAAARRLLNSLWDAYSGDRATPAKRSASRVVSLRGQHGPSSPPAVPNEGPVAVGVALAAAGRSIRASF